MAGNSPRRGDRTTFRPGAVFTTAVNLWIGNVQVFVPLALLVYLPYIATLAWLTMGPSKTDPGSFGGDGTSVDWALVSGSLLASGLLNLVVTATLVFAVFTALRGGALDIGRCLRKGLSVLPIAILVTLACGMAVLMAVIGAAIPGVIVGLAAQRLGVALVYTGMIASAIWVLVVLFVALPAAVVERPGPLNALGRSFELTRGYRWSVLLLLLLVLMVNLVIGGVSGALTTLLPDALELLVDTTVQVALGSLGSVVTAVAYHDLRVAVDGLGTDELAAVFD